MQEKEREDMRAKMAAQKAEYYQNAQSKQPRKQWSPVHLPEREEVRVGGCSCTFTVRVQLCVCECRRVCMHEQWSPVHYPEREEFRASVVVIMCAFKCVCVCVHVRACRPAGPQAVVTRALTSAGGEQGGW